MLKNFQKKNKLNINVYALTNENKVYPLMCYNDVNEAADHIDLLFIKGLGEDIQHYVYINNLSRLIRSQLTNCRSSVAICRRCFSFYHDDCHETKENKLKVHQLYCYQISETVKTNMPKSGENILKFKNYQHQLRIPSIIYCDFESLLEDCIEDNISSSAYTPSSSSCKKSSNTIKLKQHKPISFCYHIVTTDGSYKTFKYSGIDAPDVFIKKISFEAKLIYEKWNSKKDVNEIIYVPNNSVKNLCHICNKIILPSEPAVRDHCHITGHFRGLAHSSCNLQFKCPSFIPVVLHNLEHYDAHFIAKALKFSKESVTILPHTEENYISFTRRITIHSNLINKPSDYIDLKFIDSYKFLSLSLDKLAKNLPSDQKCNLNRFCENEKSKINLLSRKQYFPYNYINKIEVLEEKKIPPMQAFNNDLTQEKISLENYNQVKLIWKTFNIETIKEFLELYVTSDTILLADVFEAYRTLSLKIYGLDPAWYVSAPSFSFEAALKTTGIEIELLTDIDAYLMLEQGIRGGISQVNLRYASANNSHMKEKFKPEEEISYILYLDMNALYSYSMDQPLPYAEFTWLTETEIQNFNLMSYSKDEEYGFILEIDISYPQELHDLHCDYPFLPIKEKPPGSKQEKLLLTLNSKKNYVIHYMYLQLAIQYGLKITKIHKILKFKQKCWMAEYIKKYMDLRKVASNEFEKDYYKLLCNSVYGRTLMNIRKRQSIKLFTDAKKVEKAISRSNFKGRTIFDENLVAVHFYKEQITLNQPIFIGFSILDWSKFHMYKFVYEKYPKIFSGFNYKIAYSDTDSLITYFTHCPTDLYERMQEHKEEFDFSNYSSNHFLYDTANKRIMGKMKDELAGGIITNFIGLRSKMYYVRTLNSKEDKKKAKGVKTLTLQKEITYNDYYNALFKNITKYVKMILFRCYHHNIYTIEQKKVALNSSDDKRYILPNNIDTLPYGHKDIGEKEEADLTM